jgi:hypothetical protein
LIEKADINGTNGFVFVSEQSKTGRFGAAAAAGDLNGDGFDDLVFGAPTLSTTSTISNIEKGAAYVLYGRDFTGAVDDAGTSGDDSLSGTAVGESLIGGLGADTLTGGGGEDVLYGASGDDLIEVANLSFRLIDGGLGADELVILGAGRSLDLTAMSDLTITGIERIDIDGSGANSIKLAQRDVLALGDGNQVVIDGGSDDSVDFVGTWSTNGIADGDGYYHYTSGAATVLIDSDLTIG